MKTNRNIRSFLLFVFTRHGAKKGLDRFYAWVDALAHLKRRWFMSFLKIYFDFQAYYSQL
ncbi:hypothetical protein CN354_06940 [Bacillus cereus]|nr:hypothetical protein CN354_06940 [Bacillus cereus]